MSIYYVKCRITQLLSFLHITHRLFEEFTDQVVKKQIIFDSPEHQAAVKGFIGYCLKIATSAAFVAVGTYLLLEHGRPESEKAVAFLILLLLASGVVAVAHAIFAIEKWLQVRMKRKLLKRREGNTD